MRTEESLRDAFEHLADQAPHPSDVRTSLQPRGPRRPRRTAAIICTAVVTASAAIAAVVGPQVISADSGPAAQVKGNTAWSRWVDLNLPKNFKAVDQRFTANRQDYELVDTDVRAEAPFCQLQLHRNGDFDPSTIPAGAPTVPIGEHTARVVTLDGTKSFMPPPSNYSFPQSAKLRKVLAWEPIDGLWALLSCETLIPRGADIVPTTEPEPAVSLAKLISPPTGRLGSPVKLGELPKGVSPSTVHYQPYDSGIPGSGEEFTSMLSDGNPATGYVPPVLKPAGLVSGNPWDPSRGDDLSIRYDTGRFWNQMTQIRGGKADAVIHGMKAYYTNAKITYSKTDPTKVTLSGPVNTLRLEANGVAIVISSYAAKPSMEQLKRVAESTELTKSPKNPAAWFDAATAIP